MVLVPLAPCASVKLLGEAERTKLPGGFTARETLVVFDRLPEVPMIVTVAPPMAAALLAVSVNVLVLVVLAGLNDAVTPLGKPDADRFTLLLKPFCGVTLMVRMTLVPCATVKLLGDAESEKLGAGGAGIIRETLSKEAVASEDVVRLLTASPMYTFVAMLTVWLVPNCAQFTPSAELYRLNTFPLLTSLIQLGSAPPPNDW